MFPRRIPFEIAAEQAKLIGLVNHVFGGDNFAAAVDDYVKGFEKLSKHAIALTKTLLYQTDGLGFPEALETGADVNVIARMSEDCQKGIARFLQKT